MESPILRQIAKFLQERKNHKRWKVVFVGLAVIVGVSTVIGLRMMGLAMTHKERVLNCQFKLHEHTDACYDQDNNVICGYADYAVHKHNDDCYNADLKLVCPLPEIEKHEHTEKCYDKVVLLVCGQEEAAGHEHTDACYTKQKGSLACTAAEHEHTDACYDEEQNLTCNLEEHKHDDNCYNWEDVLTCTLPEGDGGHKHTDECYKMQEGLTCGQLEMHTHTEKCFEKIDKDGTDEPENLRLICDKTELTEHVHTEAFGCLKTVEVTPGETAQEIENGDGTSEDGLFTTDLNGEGENGADGEAAEGEEGTDGEAAGDEAGTDGEAAEGEAGIDGETAGDEAGTGEDGETADGGEAGDGTDADEAEMKPEDYDETKTYEGLGYIVSASYNKEANIPEEAKLIAEQITEVSDSEDYKKHEAEFKKNMGDENATMSALFKIGFYVDGEEVEPENPVLVTIQFVDKNGLPEGAPIKVVHFGDDETEVIDGGKAESGSTSFKTKGFSKFAVGFSKEEADAEKSDSETVTVSESYKYESDAFDITFHIEGEAVILKDKEEEKTESSVKDEKSEPEKDEEASVKPEDNGEKNSDENSVGEDDKKDNAENDVTSKDNDKPEFNFEVKTLDENSEEYKAFSTYAEGLNEKSQLFLVEPISYSLTYGGKELDLSGCEVEARLTPKKALGSYAKETIVDADADDTKKANKIEEGKENPIQIDLVIVEESEKGINEVADATLWNEDIADDEEVEEAGSASEQEGEETGAGSAEADNDVVFHPDSDSFGVTAAGTAYPKFTVQYYAYLDSLVTTDEWREGTGANGYRPNVTKLTALSLIDTSKTTGIGGLPVHEVNYADWSNEKGNTGLINLELDANGRVRTVEELTEVYLSKQFDFNKAPNINYFDALDKNTNYKLKEIWILKEKSNPQSTNPDDWEVKKYTENIGFTNRKETADNNPNYIWISDEMIMRLVYDAQNKDQKFNSVLYDYDISNGTTTNGNVSVMNTKCAGINSGLDTSKNTDQYAFGNKNCGVDKNISEGTWNGNHLNMTNADKGYLGCTFGLVSGVNEKNEIVFSSGIIGPNIFGSSSSEPQTGKTPYDAQLTFNQKGDTYTLTSVNGTNVSASNLDCFNHPSGHNHILTNNFWPLDNVPADQRKDMLFGATGQQTNQKFGGGEWDRLPESDDGKDHNSFFGMFYEVEFDLSEEYVGPLEYLFYGDDDMWVFLDGQLVCDIGGVHSSVGQYVDLWDYLGTTDDSGNRVVKPGEDKKHTLKFFYTERGASGSSCWMQFTLPSVTSRDTDPASGRLSNSLIVTKTVASDSYTGIDLNKEYSFEINFKRIDENKETPLLNNYGYKKYKKIREFDENGIPKVDENGKPVYEKEEKDGKLVDKTIVKVENGLIADGDTFKLADSEYIVIDYLPENTTYTIREVRDKDNPNYSISTTVDGEKQENSTTGTVQDQIDSKVESDVEYTNDFSYELPETGGSGMMKYTIAGALCILLGAGFMYTIKAKERRV